MMNVVFILGSSVNQNGIKRIDEFCARGYNVKAYGFYRNMKVDNKPKDVEMKIVGEFTNDMPYKNRIGIINRGIKQVLNETKDTKSIYYLIGTDIGLVFSFISKKPYIYEEADLVHTYLGNKILRNLFGALDKRVIRKSVLTVFRSEGFIRYHFGKNCPENVTFIANRLNKAILDYKTLEKPLPNVEHLKFGFAGAIRFESIYNFARILLENFPQHEFHFYGTPFSEEEGAIFGKLEKFSNCYFHGPFKNPVDLPAVYGNIDLVLSTYDVVFENVRYAEPNKIYEAMYFDTPIIVSTGTFLAEKTNMLGIGYDVDAMNEEQTIAFIKNLTNEGLADVIKTIKSIDKKTTLNINDDFFEKFDSRVSMI